MHLPKDYDPNRGEGYPVIYMLDAGSKDKMTAEISRYYHWGEIMPEVIVVGLKNIRRGLDFLPPYYDQEQTSGNGGKLLAHIKDELVPFIDNEFRTSDRRVFAGHSWAGQFLTYTLSQSPETFDAYFISSPAFGNEQRWGTQTFEILEETLRKDLDFPDFIYLSVGGAERASFLSGYYRLAGLLKEQLPATVNFYHEIHEHAVHQSNGAISMPKAMQLYFSATQEVQ